MAYDARRHRLRIEKASSAKERAARRAMNDALRKLEPRLALAFGRAVQVILRQPGMMRDLKSAIDAGDFAAAEQIVGVDRLADAMRGEGLKPGVATFHQEATAAMAAGGVAGQMQLGGQPALLMASLDLTNPAAVKYLRETLPSTIVRITEESRLAVRTALMRGFEEGRPAVKIAQDVRNAVGLTPSQQMYVSNFRSELETGEVFGTLPGDRRLNAAEQARADRMFRQAAAGAPAKQKDINAMVNRYQESLINRRARNIARTEATRAFGEGQNELWRQATERGLLDPTKTRRYWLTTPDERLRESHAAVPGMNPNGVRLDEPFNTPWGFASMPRGPDVPVGEAVNCRCTVILEIDE